jgi:hypothetical protein
MGYAWQTLKLRLFALAKIPLIHYVRPCIVSLTDGESVIKIPFKRRNKNHLNSMYFGTLSVGADLCVGLLATHHMEKASERVVLVFKDFKADFKKLTRGDVHFICKEGDKVRDLVTKTIQTKERQSMGITGYAVVPSIDPNDVVMEFTLTLSLKSKS